MRGLPDSAIVGTYKRLNRKGKRKPMSVYQQEADFLNGLIFKMLVGKTQKKNKR